jgi:hypothetical protein
MSDEDRQGLNNADIENRLWRIREINRRHASGEISAEERYRLHDEIEPGLGTIMCTRSERPGKMK